MGEFTIERSRLLPQAPEKVWAVIVDVAAWPAGKPFIAKVKFAGGELKVGTRFRMDLRMKGLVAPTPVTVTKADRPREVAWTGGLRGLVMSTHGFILQEREGSTMLTSYERFRGPLVGLMLRLVTPADLGRLHEDWLAALGRMAAGGG
jgi:hypothetical protein